MSEPIKPPCTNNFGPNRELHSPSGINLSNMMKQQDREWQEHRQQQPAHALGQSTVPVCADKHEDTVNKRKKWLDDAVASGTARRLD